MTYSFAPNDQPLYVSENDYVQFRFVAPNRWNFTNTVTITIGDLTQFWLITTIPEDSTPDPFPFNKIDEADLDTMYTTDIVFRPPDGTPSTSLSGLTLDTQAAVVLGSNLGGGIENYAMRVDYNGNGTWDTGWIQSGGAITVTNGARIRVRLKSSEFTTQFSRLTLVIGPDESSARWDILTIGQPTNEPEPFPDFTDLEDQPTNTYCYSEVIRLQGLIASANINTSGNGEWAISSTSNTSTNSDGFQVLSGATFTGNDGTVNNGDYLQLRILSSNNALFPVTTNLSIGDALNGDSWSVETGANPSTNPNSFSFTNVDGAIEDTFVASDEQPASALGIQGLTDGIQVPVVLVSTNSTKVRIKKNNDSVGVFPTTAGNGDKLTLYLQSSPLFNTPLTMQIQVGDRQIPPWQVKTSLGPDTDADWSPPANRNNQIPESFVSSAPITVTGINRPITIESIAGYPALISIDFDPPVAGPRTFDPLVNSSFYIVVQAALQLNTPETTTIRLGTGDPNQFIWQVTTYATVPPPSTDAAIWYSRKSKKFDGYPIGTVLPVLKESVGSYGDLDGGNNDRYPGFVPCDGRSLDKNDYFELYTILAGEYGETTNEFNVPDYRNRKLCGIGIVDSTRGNSAFVPITLGSSKGINDPGAEGGYWYFNRVGARGSNPLDQVQGPPGAVGSLDSDFFSLGTVRLTGLETLTDQVIFEINPNSFVTAQVGGLSSITVAAPTHNHAYISAVTEGDEGEANIPWGNTLGKSMMGAARYNPSVDNPDVFSANAPEGASSEQNTKAIRDAWKNFFGTTLGAGFQLELTRYYGSDFDFEDWVKQFPTNFPYNSTIDGAATAFGPESSDLSYSTQFQTWWISPFSALAGANLQNRAASWNPTAPDGSTNRYWSGVFDTQPSTFAIEQYLNTAPGTQTRTHSHLITENPVGNPNADFTGGNQDGVGSNQTPYGSGLGGPVNGVGGAADKLQVVFTQGQVFSDLTNGTFTYSSSFKRPTPDVEMQPQRQVPIINPFHKTKYIIKAY